LGQADGWELGTLNMARRGSVLNNKTISMNSFRFVYFENYQRRSPIPHKRDRDRVPLCNNGTDLLVRRLFGGAPIR
jgi:hypothetical protein